MINNMVTVVIPIYNTEKYLEKCVTSVTSQTFKDIEILLINDGSLDNSGELCDKLAKTDSRIKVIHKENGGAASVRNMGIETAKGEYIMFLDSDDWLDHDALETLVSHAITNQTDVIKFNYVREFANKQLPKRNTFLEERVYEGDECKTVCRQILGLTGTEVAHPENMNFLASCGFNMYRTELLRKSDTRFTNIKEIGSFVDGLFNFCVFMDVNRFEFIDKPFYHYRKTNETAATVNYRKNYVARQHVLFEKLKNKIFEVNEWEFFREAYNNRLVFSTMEISFNALRNKAPFNVKYNEIRSVLKDETFKAAYKNFSLKYLGLKWKIYFFFIKHSLSLPTYLMTSVILMLKNRGVL